MIMPFVLGKNIPELFNAYMNKHWSLEATERKLYDEAFWEYIIEINQTFF